MNTQTISKAAIIGLGAVGAVVASELQSVKGLKLECIVNKERKERYTNNGIFINGKRQNFNLVTPEEAEQADIVIIATKNLQTLEALSEIKNAVGPDTMILSLMNGIQSEKEIEKVYGEEQTLYGFIINITSVKEGLQINCTSNGTIVFGEKNNFKTERISAVKELFEKAGISYRNPENIQFEMWKKFLINTTFNSVGALCRSPYGGFKYEELQSLVKKIGLEVINVANAENIPLTENLLEEDIKLTCSYTPEGKCSMLQDMEASRLTENDFFCGTVMRLGKEHNISTPYCEFMYLLLKGTELARNIIHT